MRRLIFFSSTMDLLTSLSRHDTIGKEEEGDIKLSGKNVN